MLSPECPRAHLILVRISASDAAMADDYGKMSREALARANALSEIANSWGLVIAAIVVAIAAKVDRGTLQ